MAAFIHPAFGSGTGTPGSGDHFVRLRIKLEGVAYDVEVETLPERAHIEAAPEPELPEGYELPPPPPDIRPQDRICRSPISGLVISTQVVPGSCVRKEETIAVVEAMKMLISIPAPLDGIVEEVQVRAGDSVSPGQVLCTLI
jgi:biotin carboxyl carrier protein